MRPMVPMTMTYYHFWEKKASKEFEDRKNMLLLSNPVADYAMCLVRNWLVVYDDLLMYQRRLACLQVYCEWSRSTLQHK